MWIMFAGVLLTFCFLYSIFYSSHMNYRALLLTVEDVPFTAAITNHHVVIMKALDMVIPHTSEGVVLHEARLDADGEVPVAVEDIEERTTRFVMSDIFYLFLVSNLCIL